MTIGHAALRITDSTANLFGLLDRPLDPDRLIDKARRRTGLEDFGEFEFYEPLCRLLTSCAHESALSIVGRSATNWDVIRLLSNLLLIQQEIKRSQGIEREVVERPIFITGLPRSGTTFLHRLMLIDAGNRAPLVWETIYPSPASGSKDKRIARVTRQLRAFEWLAPTFRNLHPLDATSPQECSEITSHVFRSLRFDTTYHIPSYRDWLDSDESRYLPAYRFHKRFLQYLQFQDKLRRRWVLKCPEHLFSLNAIRSVYPDARIVFVHRDPVKVLLSQARLTEVLRQPFTRNLDPYALGSTESHRWLDGTQRMIGAAADAGFAEAVCHVHHMDLISDPVSTVEGVYRHFGMDFPSSAGCGIAAYVAARPRGGYGERSYRFDDHGLNEQRERDRFRPYMLRFGVTTESAPPLRAVVSAGHVGQAGERSLQA